MWRFQWAELHCCDGLWMTPGKEERNDAGLWRPDNCSYMFPCLVYLGCFNDVRCSVCGLKPSGFACQAFAVALALSRWTVASFLKYEKFLNQPFTQIYDTIYHIFDIHIDGRSYLSGRCPHLLDLNRVSGASGLWKPNKALTEMFGELHVQSCSFFCQKDPFPHISHTRPHISPFECCVP